MRYAMVVLAVALIVFGTARAAAAASETETASAAVAGGETPSAAAVTIGIVDVKRVVEECEYKKLYEKRIEALFQKKRLEGLDLKREVEKNIDEIKRLLYIRTDETKEELEQQIKAQERRLLDFANEAKRAVEEENRKYSEELEAKVKDVVETAADEHGINVVINSMAVLYKNGVADLTDLVLQKLNEAYRAEYGDSATGANGTPKGAGTGGDTSPKGN